jgi:hypothetical protein
MRRIQWRNTSVCWKSSLGLLIVLSGCVGDVLVANPYVCTILDASFVDGTLDPGNPCQACNYERDPQTWTVLADGTSCPRGICIQQLCQPGCVIAGMAVRAGTDPNEPCRACEPGTSTNDWVLSRDQTPCRPASGAGAFCVKGICDGCLAAGEVCSNGADCCSRLCDGQRCYDQLLGGGCEDDRSCSPGVQCQRGVCCSLDAGSGCFANDWCCPTTSLRCMVPTLNAIGECR